MANFSDALEALYQGQKIHRKNWNRKDIFVQLSNIFFKGHILLNNFTYCSHAILVYKEIVCPWNPSQIDIFSNDWYITGEKDENQLQLLKDEYIDIDTFDFAEALRFLKIHKRIYRLGWSREDLYIRLQEPTIDSNMTEPYITIEYPDDGKILANSSSPWQPTNSDLFTRDWVVLDNE